MSGPSNTPQLELLRWDVARAIAQPIRVAVFCVEQGIALELESDQWDALSWHCLARVASGKALGTGRLLPDGHIGRMAVLAEGRGQGLGGAILEALVAKGGSLGMAEIVLNAQLHALDFYTRHGFQKCAPPYLEAGIVHVTMRRGLRQADGRAVTLENPAT